MEKRVYFAIATAIVVLTVGFWVKVRMGSNAAQPQFELSSSLALPYLPVRVLDSVY
jgi:hypothetical protein